MLGRLVKGLVFLAAFQCMAKNAPNGKLHSSLVAVTWQTVHMMSIHEHCALEFSFDLPTKSVTLLKTIKRV